MNSYDLEMLSHHVGVPFQILSTRTMTRVNNAPQAQKRTATYKKAVYIVQDLVFKGPYACDDLRLMNNLRYTYAVQLLEEVLQLPEWQRGALSWKYIGQWGIDQYYLVAHNVGSWKNISPNPAESGFDPTAMIVSRKMHVMRASEIEGTPLLTDDIKLAALQHLYLRFILGIGDSGTHNVLVRKDYDNSGRLVAGIDLEDRRGNIVRKSRFAFLFGKLYKKHIVLYKSDIHNIKSLSYSQLGQRTLGRLSAVDIDLKKLKLNMARW
jgi:hypothetical protein